ncbi:MAG TPA: hypothetical protein VLV78_17270 [Thermoanaerobaculia bacterium]|nr:hypothetical protein [Thermoanaerobaculia bacterium]
MPFDPSDTVRASLQKLLAQKSGFVVFDDGKDVEYVQYSLEPDGLMLDWPSGYTSVEPEQVAALLRQLKVEPDVADDAVYAKFGRDVDKTTTFTMRAFRELYRRDPKRLNVRLEES